MDIRIKQFYLMCHRTVSTTVDPFRDISLDLAPSSIVNRTSTPVEINGTFYRLFFFASKMGTCYMYVLIQDD